MSLLKKYDKNICKEDYLSGELISDIKHEYIDANIYAMSGASTNHNRIISNLSREFGTHLKNTPCESFSSDMKVQVENDFFYPDSLVVCDHIANDNGITDNPLIIVEILSKSTRQIDHTLKRNAYQSLESLLEYIVIEQDVVDIEVCRRKKHWQPEHYYLGDEIYLESIDQHISVLEIYDRVVNADIESYFEQLEKQQ